MSNTEEQLKSARLANSLLRQVGARELDRAEKAEAELAIARACAECNTHGACSTPWPCAEAAECPGAKS